MISKKLMFGFVISPLAAAAVISAVVLCFVMMGFNTTFREASHGIDRLFIFSMIFSYAMVIVVGFPLCILSRIRQWYELWPNALAGFAFGFGVGVFVIVFIILLHPSFKWINSLSPLIVALFFGIAGSITMSALWPFIDHERQMKEHEQNFDIMTHPAD